MMRSDSRSSRAVGSLTAAVFALTTVAASWPAPSRAQTGAEEAEDTRDRVLVVPMQRSEDVSSIVPGRISEYLRTILEMNDRLKVFSPDTLQAPATRDKPRVPETDPVLVAGDEALWAGKELMDANQPLKAVEAFKKAMAAYEKGIEKLVDFDKYIDAALAVSLAYYAAGYDDNGEDALVPVIVMRPELLLDKRKVPPAAVAALDRLKRIYKASSEATGKVTVKSMPEGAEVYIDGQRVGVTPYETATLWRGRHIVKIAAEHHFPWAKTVVVTNRDQTVAAKLKSDGTQKAPGEVAEALPQTPEGLAVAARDGRFDAGFLKLAAALSDRYDLDAIVLTYLRRTPTDYELAPFVYSRSMGTLAELEWIHLDHDLATMQVNLLILEEKLLSAFASFPVERVLKRRSAIYEPLTPPAPVATAPPTTTPPPVATAPPATTPPPVTTPPPTATAPPATTPPPVATAPPATTPPPVATAPPTTTAPPREGAPLTRPEPPPTVVRAPDYQVDDTRPGLGAYDYAGPGTAKASSSDRSWYQKWWVWVLAAGVVAGGTTAAVLATRPDDGGPEGFRTTVSW